MVQEELFQRRLGTEELVELRAVEGKSVAPFLITAQSDFADRVRRRRSRGSIGVRLRSVLRKIRNRKGAYACAQNPRRNDGRKYSLFPFYRFHLPLPFSDSAFDMPSEFLVIAPVFCNEYNIRIYKNTV